MLQIRTVPLTICSEPNTFAMAFFFGGVGEDDVSDSGSSGKEIACEVDGLSCVVSMVLDNEDNSK